MKNKLVAAAMLGLIAVSAGTSVSAADVTLVLAEENAEDSQDDSQTDPKETEEKTSTGNALNSSISKSNTVGYKK